MNKLKSFSLKNGCNSLRKTFVIIRFFSCFLLGHKVNGQRVCSRCQSEFGVPKMKNPPPPIKIDEFDKEFGFILKYKIDSIENYERIKLFWISQQNQNTPLYNQLSDHEN